MPDEIVGTVWINASPQRVLRVLTEADLVSQWFGDRTSIDLRPGGAMELWWRELTYLATPQPLRATSAWLAARASAWDAHLTAIKTLAETDPG